MIKRTLYFGNPAYLSKHLDQMKIEMTDSEKEPVTIPIEDIGIVVIDHYQITITSALLQSLTDNNTAVISCDAKRMPSALFMPLAGNSTQTERYRYQIEASEPLRKQMWQQTVKSKILNQAQVLNQSGVNIQNMLQWAGDVKSGDTGNHEARAAAYYWSRIFPSVPFFHRHREGEPPNNILNYGYAVLRAVIARSLVASGLLPTFGIHHRNRYNAYCLADDIMEPYRPFVDRIVINIVDSGIDYSELDKSIKQQLLTIPAIDVVINDERSPLMIAAQQTTASVYKCFSGELRRISYPGIEK